MIIIEKKKVDTAFPDYLLPYTYYNFIHVYNAMALFWGTKDFAEYMVKTLTTDRAGRAGFPRTVIQELFVLKQEHDIAFPQFVKVTVWDNWYQI